MWRWLVLLVLVPSASLAQNVLTDPVPVTQRHGGMFCDGYAQYLMLQANAGIVCVRVIPADALGGSLARETAQKNADLSAQVEELKKDIRHLTDSIDALTHRVNAHERSVAD